MLTHMVVILDRHAVSFCHYENEDYSRPGSDPIPIERLQQAIAYARQNGMTISFIYGNRKLPEEHESLIATVDHVKIAPLHLRERYPEATLVVSREDRDCLGSLDDCYLENLILRVAREDLPCLAESVIPLLGRFRMLNLCLLQIESYGETELGEYERQLAALAGAVRDYFHRGNSCEIDFLTGRMLLCRMNNCDPGLKQITIAPDGKFYLCPGFYHDREQRDWQGEIGCLDSGLEIRNAQLLDLDHAPVCRLCDAYHCKRCLYLNRKTTLEINTPPVQQCTLSHLEREAAANLLEELRFLDGWRELAPIPRLDYRDPFTLIHRSASSRG
jgi:CXXX repeat peptide maturase